MIVVTILFRIGSITMGIPSFKSVLTVNTIIVFIVVIKREKAYAEVLFISAFLGECLTVYFKIRPIQIGIILVTIVVIITILILGKKMIQAGIRSYVVVRFPTEQISQRFTRVACQYRIIPRQLVCHDSRLRTIACTGKIINPVTDILTIGEEFQCMPAIDPTGVRIGVVSCLFVKFIFRAVIEQINLKQSAGIRRINRTGGFHV